MVMLRACSVLVAVASMYGCGVPSDSDPTIPLPTGSAGEDEGDSADDDGEPEPELDCGPTFDDDLVLVYDEETIAPHRVRTVASVAGNVVVGGEGFGAVLGEHGFGPMLELTGDVQAIVAVGDDRVALGTSTGEIVVAELDGEQLEQRRTTSVSGGVRGLASDGLTIWAALGDAGLHAVPVDGGTATRLGDVAVARDVALAHGRIVVAAGTDGVLVLDVAGTLLGSVATETAVHGIAADGDRAVALRGAQGWDLLEIGDGAPRHVASTTTGGLSLDAAFREDEVLVVEGWAITRYDVSGGTPVPIGIEHRRDVGQLAGTWLRGIARRGKSWIVVDDAAAIPLEVHDAIEAPNVAVDVPSFAVWAEPGETSEAAYLLRNTGTADLLVGDVEADGDFTAALQTDGLEEHPLCDGYFVVPPGATVLVDLEFAAGEDPSESTLTIRTNDPDEPRLEIPLEGNRERVRAGDEAVDFTALGLDGELFRLSDHAGKVVFLKMFNYGCATCAEEFGDVQQSLVPSFAADDFVAVGINTTHRTAYADKVAADAGLTIPVVLDMDSEAFRHYRVPNHVFPLHVVIDRDGKIVHVDDQPGLATVEEAIRAAM